MKQISWLVWPRLVAVIYLGYVLVAILGGKTWFFVDNANLLFHEAGHVIFGLFGLIGGTMMQLMIPFSCAVYFWIRRERFSGAMCGFWVGENLFNVSAYIKDALVKELYLVGGGVHDWELMLSRWGMLNLANEIGWLVFGLAAMVMLAMWGWMVYLTVTTKPEVEAEFI